MLLLNTKSNRQLREGDRVSLKTGKVGTIVGIDVFETSSILVQDEDGELWKASPNGVDLVQEGPAGLEPLPSIVSLLTENKIKDRVYTSASSIVLVTETNLHLTLLPKSQKSNLIENFKKLYEKDGFAKTVLSTLKESYVTRLPHLLESKIGKRIDSSLRMKVDEAIEELRKKVE